ncbi:MAG: bifunctional 2-polyprenyl-6-hydroxyphenol methylase/3-demethylubiquinol 3-O-methyltransferase UbiG [Bacteriovoracaceae bacterium]
MAKNEVNNSIYELYGDRWYTAYDDPIALLRAENKVKTPWIASRIKNQESHVLDVGCGGGFLSNALSNLGFLVTGVDLSQESLNVAERFDSTKKVKYLCANAYELPFPDQSFDVVTAMDFLEHVDDPQRAVSEFARVLKPGGQFFYHTFNRNLLSWFVIIKLVEWLVKNTPKDMHVLRLFIKPNELVSFCNNSGMKVEEMTGIKPLFSSIKLSDVFKRTVPQEMSFELTSSLTLSYMGVAIKN